MLRCSYIRLADAPLFVYIPQLNKSAHVSIGQFWSIDLQTAVTTIAQHRRVQQHPDVCIMSAV